MYMLQGASRSVLPVFSFRHCQQHMSVYFYVCNLISVYRAPRDLCIQCLYTTNNIFYVYIVFYLVMFLHFSIFSLACLAAWNVY